MGLVGVCCEGDVKRSCFYLTLVGFGGLMRKQLNWKEINYV